MQQAEWCGWCGQPAADGNHSGCILALEGLGGTHTIKRTRHRRASLLSCRRVPVTEG